MKLVPTLEKIRAQIAQREWRAATESLAELGASAAADLLSSAPFEEQRRIFRNLPVKFAAELMTHFPYFHAYVLLHSRPTEEMRAIINEMPPAMLDHFLDELPEETWQSLANELAGPKTSGERPSGETTAVEEEPVGPPKAAAPIIEAIDVEKSFQQPGGREIQVIAPISLALEAGIITAVLGPSGSGKSTLLRILSGLTQPTRGAVTWHGKPMAQCQPNVAIVFQNFALFPWLTVLENVEAPLLARGFVHEVRHLRALQALTSVGLKGFENAYPKELSGGMKQRVGFARALAVEPEILFMDEPFSALDVLTAENLRGELMEQWLAKKIPTRSIFIVTHNIEEAVLLADQVIVLGKSPARIRADFRVMLTHPRDRKSAAFLMYVDYIYKVMTQPELEFAPPMAADRLVKTPFQSLPHARPGGVTGLLELLMDRGGEEDLYHVADELQFEVDDLLPIVEAATLLGFATAREGDVMITPSGIAFAQADIQGKKKLFREAALAHVMLLQRIRATLDTKGDKTMPVEFFRDLLDEHLSEKETAQQIETALNWGRYGEIFTYDPETDRIQLYRADRSENSNEIARLH